MYTHVYPPALLRATPWGYLRRPVWPPTHTLARPLLLPALSAARPLFSVSPGSQPSLLCFLPLFISFHKILPKKQRALFFHGIPRAP
jgi:hypothetical protein